MNTALHQCLPVLIETYWNVNETLSTKPYTQSGINRNILECKYDKAMLRKRLSKGINRNILECK